VITQSDLIEEQIKNVGKLVVSEGYFSEVLTYNDSKELFGSYFTADKKALVIAKSNVTVAYDLGLLKYELNPEQKVLNITYIPTEQISIYPEFEYYDIQSDFFNPFEASDYNSIKTKVKKNLQRLLMTGLCLRPLLLLLRNNAKLMVGACLFIAIVALDEDF